MIIATESLRLLSRYCITIITPGCDRISLNWHESVDFSSSCWYKFNQYTILQYNDVHYMAIPNTQYIWCTLSLVNWDVIHIGRHFSLVNRAILSALCS